MCYNSVTSITMDTVDGFEKGQSYNLPTSKIDGLKVAFI